VILFFVKLHESSLSVYRLNRKQTNISAHYDLFIQWASRD